MPVYPYVYFQVWNPYQAPSASAFNSTNYPSNFRIVPYQNTSNPAYSDDFQLWLIVGLSTGTYKWAYDPATNSWPGTGSSPIYYFASLGTSYGGGSETNSSAGLNFALPNPQNNYREPGLVVGSPNPALNGSITPAFWQPGVLIRRLAYRNLAAISLPAITAFPPNGTTNTSSMDIRHLPPPIGPRQPCPPNAVSCQTDATFVQQFKDSGGNWQTYGTFIGMDSQSVSAPTGWNGSMWMVPTRSVSPNDVAWAKTDPRTFRFGLGDIEQQQGSHYTITAVSPNSTNPPSLTPTSPAWTIFESHHSETPPRPPLPYRMDYWVANNPANPVQGSSYSGNNSPYITDLDGIIRGADSAYAYSTSGTAWGSNPTLPGGKLLLSAALPARPVMLHHPFNSVGDLGYAYRDDPCRTLDLMTPGSADAGLLDLFSLSEAPIVAGRINPTRPTHRSSRRS